LTPTLQNVDRNSIVRQGDAGSVFRSGFAVSNLKAKSRDSGYFTNADVPELYRVLFRRILVVLLLVLSDAVSGRRHMSECSAMRAIDISWNKSIVCAAAYRGSCSIFLARASETCGTRIGVFHATEFDADEQVRISR
jgi:hypothetical protein